jgi:pimeloyl-ACP methyl ester carboxylesterase
MRLWILVACLSLSSCTGIPGTAEVAGSTPEKLQQLGGEPCPDSELTCITLEVQLDESDARQGTVDVTFGVLPASGTPEGVLVTAVGGPGSSGIYDSQWRLASLDPAIHERFDIVYFDQRGVGLFEEPSCPDADASYWDGYESLPEQLTQRWRGLVQVADSFVESCVIEMGDPEFLAHLGTADAVRDLEAFRQAMGYDKLVIYGESYGTLFAQTYASAYPDAVERLVLDGTIDATRDGIETTIDQIDAFDDLLKMIFEACDEDVICSGDMGMPAERAYANLMRALEVEPATVRFPVEGDVFEDLLLTGDDVGYLAFSSVYSADDRMMFLRALAAATSRDDLIPMMRLWEMTYGSGGSTMMTTAVSCLDSAIPGVNADAELEALTAAWEVTPELHQWFYEISLMCVYWPNVDRTLNPPAPFRGEGIPTLVVAAEGDPATPYSQGVAVFEGLDEGYLLSVIGGSHVMFGRGIACIDTAVTSFILDGTKPPAPKCVDEVIAPYAGLLPDSPFAVKTEELLLGLDNELYYLPELVSWSWDGKRSVGCSHGGRVTFTSTDVGAHYVLNECALTDHVVASGTGDWDFEVGTTRLEVAIERHECAYIYTQAWETGAETLELDC